MVMSGEFKNGTGAEGIAAVIGGVGEVVLLVALNQHDDNLARSIDGKVDDLNSQVITIAELKGENNSSAEPSADVTTYLNHVQQTRSSKVKALEAQRPDTVGDGEFYLDLFGGMVLFAAVGAIAVNRVRYAAYRFKNRKSSDPGSN
jgi:hypothetical protein